MLLKQVKKQRTGISTSAHCLLLSPPDKVYLKGKPVTLTEEWMNRAIRALLMGALLVSAASHTVRASVIATQRDVINGKKNLADSLFLNMDEANTGLGAAVRSLLTDNTDMSNAAKATVLRSVISAVEHLPRARGLYDDVSAIELYSTLLTYDLIADKSVFSDLETTSLKNNIKLVLNHYSNPDNFAWDDARWSVGVTALRLIAAEALYSFIFQDDFDTDRFRIHSLRYLEKNIEEGIDDHGAWIPDSPGYLNDAIEYLIVAAKVFRNAGIHDAFVSERLRNLLTWGIRVMPSQGSNFIRGEFMMPSVGETEPNSSPASTAILAVNDIAVRDLGAAAALTWYWQTNGSPVSPLGLLFIDTAFQPEKPKPANGASGIGTVIFRDKSATSEESYLAVSFGGAENHAERNGFNHDDNGDFSFVWRGYPLIVHDGAGDDPGTRHLMNRSPWRHSLVLREGAGDSPMLPLRDLGSSTVRKDITGHDIVPTDLYTGGIRQLLMTPSVDYVSGDVRISQRGITADSYQRHFLFLKPDALLMWDQIESSFPLEWNIWAACDNIWAENNILHLHTVGNIDLQAHFAGDTTVDYLTEQYPQEITWDWPLVMRTEYGGGSIIAVCVNLFDEAIPDSITLADDLMGNILLGNVKPSLVGLLTVNERITTILGNNNIPGETLTYETAGSGDLTRYSMLILGDRMTTEHERLIRDYGWKINDFIERGGKVVVLGGKNIPWLSDCKSCTDTIPVPLVFGESSFVVTEGDASIKMHGDPIWHKPTQITGESWRVYTPKADSVGIAEQPPVLAYTIPVAWSDAWKVLASYPHAFPMIPHESQVYGRPSRIRVRHPASRDFFTLFLPRKIGNPTYLFDVKRIEQGFVSFADPTTTWEITAGETTWTDANLSVMIDSLGVRKLYAFDCTYIRLGTETIQADSPMSIYYSERDDNGVIMTATNNRVSCSRHELRPYAGTVRFDDLFGDISLERITYLSTLKVSGSDGIPLEGARIYQDGRLVGATDGSGSLPVRWTGSPPTLRIHYRGSETLANLVPGNVDALINRR